MSYIITNGQHYKDIATAIRSKMLTDREYAPSEMASAIANIPSSADGTNDPIIGIYLFNPNENGHPTKLKVVGWSLDNKETAFKETFDDYIFKDLESVEFINCDIKKWNCMFQNCTKLKSVSFPADLQTIGNRCFSRCENLTTVILPKGIKTLDVCAFEYCASLSKIHLPNTLSSFNGSFLYCGNLEDVTLDNDFNCNNVNLASSTKYSHDTILSWLNALADRTGLTAYTLTIGATNLAKLTEDEKKIATDKNWNLA